MNVKLVQCKCGGEAKYICEWGMDDQFVCTKCDYKTKSYYDGDLYAADEWNRRNTDRPSALQEEVMRRNAALYAYVHRRAIQ
jgi:hypothetical protein